jgi:hypothetical protein
MADKLDTSKLDYKTKVALTRRGRLQEGPDTSVGSGLGLAMSGAVSSAANEAAASGMVPVINPQIMRGMKLDPRGVGGQSFAELEEKIAGGDRPASREDPGTPSDADYEGYDDRGAQPGDYIGRGGTPTGGGAVPDNLISKLGGSALTKAAVTAGTGIAAGAPIGMSITGGLTKGLGVLTGWGALNELVGSVIGTEIGTSVAGPVESESDRKAREAARVAAVGDWGVAGMALRNLGSVFGISKSSRQVAQEAYDTSKMVDNQKAAGEQWAQGLNRKAAPTGFLGTAKSYYDRVKSMVPTMTEMGFTAPDEGTFNYETLQSRSGAQVGTSGTAKASDIMANGERRGSLLGGSGGGEGKTTGSVSAAKGGYTDTSGRSRQDNWAKSTSSGGGWNTDATGSEGGFGGGGGGGGGGGK